jgi:hypothetical protein
MRYVGNNPTNTSDPSGLEKEFQRKAFWVANADKAIAGYKAALRKGASPIDVAIAKNRFITAAYAKLYLNKPKKYPWLGLAALASDEVGKALVNLRSEMQALSRAGSMWEKAGATLARMWLNVYMVTPAANALAAGNTAVYNDSFWQFLAYDAGGIKQMEWLNSKGELSEAALERWKLLDKDSWEGNKSMFRHEQVDILQPKGFDMLPRRVAEMAAEASLPLFPGATPFGKVGDNIADVKQRWDEWIEDYLWPEWKKFTQTPANAKWIERRMKYLQNPMR